MENGKWKDKILSASEIADDYTLEKEIRKASGRRELECPDSECQNPTLRYCHGEKKGAFFAHLNNDECDYSKFDKENNNITKNIRFKLVEQLKNEGYEAYPEVKILDHHYTHILIESKDKKIAVEIGTKHLSANKIDFLSNGYLEKGLDINWIVIDNTSTQVEEKHTYFLKRYLLNESTNRDLIVISYDGREVSQYKTDPEYFRHKGILKFLKYEESYYEKAELNEVTLDGTHLTIRGFTERYNNWLQKKKEYYENEEKIASKKNTTYQKAFLFSSEKSGKNNNIYKTKTNDKDTSWNNINVEKHIDHNFNKVNEKQLYLSDEEIRILVEQQDTKAYARGKHWVKCEICGKIDSDEKFSSYGGKNRLNLGICSTCSRK